MCSRNVRETVSLISRQNILCAFKIAPALGIQLCTTVQNRMFSHRHIIMRTLDLIQIAINQPQLAF